MPPIKREATHARRRFGADISCLFAQFLLDVFTCIPFDVIFSAVVTAVICILLHRANRSWSLLWSDHL